MSNYYLDSQAKTNGEHVVHIENCNYMPSLTNRILLGNFNTCRDAVANAKANYRRTKINGCSHCSKSCCTS